MKKKDIWQNLYKKGLKITVTNIDKLLGGLVAGIKDFWELVGIADMPVPYVSKTIEYLKEKKIISIEDNKIILTEEGKNFCIRERIGKYQPWKCSLCNGRGIDLREVEDFLQKFREIGSKRPSPVQEYDQGAVTPESTISRVLFLEKNCDLEGKDILVMGAEDDLTGLAVAMTNKAKSVLIIDIDERLIDFDNKIIKELGLSNTKAQVFDLRNKFPDEWISKFDVFITDPPETPAAFSAFIVRGICSIKEEGGSGYFGLTLTDSSVYRWHEFQKKLSELKVVITDIIQDFNEYMNWEYHSNTRAFNMSPVKSSPSKIWYKSAWHRIEILPGSPRLNIPIKKDNIYIDEEGSTT